MTWLKKRLSEKSTKTALIGFIPILCNYAGLSVELTGAISALTSALLLGSAVTEG